MATIRFLAGLVVERRTVRLPQGLFVGDPQCRLDPESCCGSNPDHEGCCWPAPPATLYAVRYASTAGLGVCPPVCVPLTYAPGPDAWYSTDLGLLMGGPADGLYLRLKCQDSAYTLHVVDDVDGSEGVIVQGTLSSGIEDSCDPFVVARDFRELNSSGVCEEGATYSYAVVEGSCDPDHPGSGPAGGKAPCNQTVSVNELAFGMKTGGCGCLPDAASYSGVTPGGPGNNGIWSTHSCEGNPNWYLDCVDGYYELTTHDGGITVALVSYVPSPFELVYDVTMTGSPCAGTARVTITSTG